jgi:hypothetical protein
VIFADGSRLIVGDDSSSGNDILANTLIGSRRPRSTAWPAR